MDNFRFHEPLRFAKILSLVLIIISPAIWLFSTTVAYSVPCCEQVNSDPNCMWSGYKKIACPNGDQPPSECWINKGSCSTSLECNDYDYISSPSYCRTHCDGDYRVNIRFGCAEEVEITKSWKEWDIDNPLNTLLMCYAQFCFCDEDIACTGYASGFEVTSTGNCAE